MRKYLSLTIMVVLLLSACLANPLANHLPIYYSQATATEPSNPVANCYSWQVAPANRLWCLLYERESLMKEVAANKYQYRQKKPIYDGVRELDVLSKVADNAQKKQLPLRDVQLYAQLVMDVSRQIQQYWFDLWEQQESSPAQLSLNQIRERIDQIDAAILDSFVVMRDNDSITLKQVQDGLRESLADLEGIHPSQDPTLFTDLLAKVIYAVLK
ncbi:MAG: hypothetical protein F6K47_18515 [Symploca sp. SIO2E6]|nr:hypothetical protein [Symploca sp. SIO2E6]